MRSIVAHVCLRSCNRMAGSPARFNSGLKCHPSKFVPLVVVPVVVGKTSLLSCQREPSRSFSFIGVSNESESKKRGPHTSLQNAQASRIEAPRNTTAHTQADPESPS